MQCTWNVYMYICKYIKTVLNAVHVECTYVHTYTCMCMDLYMYIHIDFH